MCRAVGAVALALVAVAGCTPSHPTPRRFYSVVRIVGPTRQLQPDYCTALAFRTRRGVVAKVWTDEPGETVRLTLHGDGTAQNMARTTNSQWQTGASFSIRHPRMLVVRVGATGPDPLATTATLRRFDAASVDCR